MISSVYYHNVEPAGLALVLVAPRAPVHPLSDLLAGPLLPHLIRVVEAPGVRAIALQGKILLRLCEIHNVKKLCYSFVGANYEYTHVDYCPRKDSANL